MSMLFCFTILVFETSQRRTFVNGPVIARRPGRREVGGHATILDFSAVSRVCHILAASNKCGLDDLGHVRAYTPVPLCTRSGDVSW